MYLNYGSENICENGRLVSSAGRRSYKVLAVDPYEKYYKVAECLINLNSKFITENYEEIRAYAGLQSEFEPADVAVAAVDYYGSEMFCRPDTVLYLTKEELTNYLKDIECEDPIKVL